MFLSYSRADRLYVGDLAQWLEAHGVSVWYDHDIDYGTKWETTILEQLDGASTVVVVMSGAARRSKWVPREIERARSKGAAILPLLLETNAIVDAVADLQFENVVGPRMPGLRFCQKLPGFLVTQPDLVEALTPAQRTIAERTFGSSGPMVPGRRNAFVAAIQIELIRVGLDPGPLTGTWNRKTQSAVAEFQRRRCHVPQADGMVGKLTWSVLLNSSLGDLAPAAARGGDGR